MAGLELPLVVPGIRLDGGDAKAEAERALARAKQPWVAGFCLFGGEAEEVRKLTDRLRSAAGREIFVASDMERGAGQQVEGLRVLPDAALVGLAGSTAEAQAFGSITARDARSVGVDVLFAPVLDVRSEPHNPIVGNRSFGWDPDRVAALGAAYCRGALDGGAIPVAKHYPGHGATTSDSHDAAPAVDEPAARLRARDVAPFLRALEEGCPAVMTAHVAYPRLDSSNAIATFSSKILGDLRAETDARELPLVVFTDALLMTGALDSAGETSAARRALRAGCDALLMPSDPERLAAELSDVRKEAEVAVARRDLLLGLLGDLPAMPPLDDGHLDGAPMRVVERALRMSGASGLDAEERGGMLCIVDDDAIPERGRLLEQRAKAAGVTVWIARLGKDAKPSTPPGKPTTIVVISSVRAWKGAANVSKAGEATYAACLAASGGRAQSVWLSPRAPESLPITLHLPGAGPDVESALADRLFGD
jgi:beta-glucosidase-like glycosyl hydrolase